MPITDEIIQSLSNCIDFTMPYQCEISPRFPELLLAIQDSPMLQNLDLSSNNLGAWDLENVQSFSAAKEYAVYMLEFNISTYVTCLISSH